MKSFMTAILMVLAFSPLAMAQEPVIYRDNVLTIPGGVIVDDAGVSYIRDIRLVNDGNGGFQVADAQEGQLAKVDEIEVNTDAVSEGRVLVTAKGFKSSACVDILEPAILRDENVFTVILPESAPKSDVCIMMLVAYEKTFSLDARRLGAGNYAVIVNGVEKEFSLQAATE